MIDVTPLRIECVEPIAPGLRRLGRHVVHDPRSKKYPAAGAAELKTTRHVRHVPIFDQGELGSCTGNACAGMLSTGPFPGRLTEADAVALYSEATHLDRVRGTYPPTDTGSSGLAVMKAAQKRGLVKDYRHAFGLQHTLAALVLSPLILGMSWLTGCDTPDRHGVVRWEGPSRGGHEVELVGLDCESRLVWIANSWSERWGLGGYFAMTWTDLERVLADRGDVTVGVL